MKDGRSLASSLTTRLLLAYLVLLVLAAAGLTLWGDLAGASEHRHPLGPASSALAHAARAGQAADTALRSAAVSELTLRRSLTGFAVWGADTGQLLLSHPPDLLLARDRALLPLDAAAPGTRIDVRHETVDGQRFVIALLLDDASPGGTLAWLTDEMRDEILPVVLPLIAASLLIVPLTVRRALRPMSDIAEQLHSAVGPDRQAVLSGRDAPREVLPFINAVDAALARLQASIERQRRFTLDAAHALRTPLTALRLRIDLLGPGPEKTTLLASVERLTDLTQRLLRLGRLERHDGANEEIDLHALAREVCDEFGPDSAARGRTIALEVNQPVPRLRADAAAVRDALENLVDNALHASPDGMEVEVAVGPGAQLEVRDRGPGIRPQDAARVFEPFARGVGTRYVGSGLGLAIVREVMTLHGGKASLEPRPGGGTLARLQFPAAE